MRRSAQSIALLVALALALLVPTASSAGAQPGPFHVIANMTLAYSGTTDVAGTVKADIHAPANWANVPGYCSFDASDEGDFKASRAVIERVWLWPWLDDSIGKWANWAFVWGNECLYSASQAPICRDIAWAFIDYIEPTLTDIQITCWWDGGIRPPNDETCDVCNGPTAHLDWYPVVRGSLVVMMNE